MLMHEESGRLKISAALGIGFWGGGRSGSAVAAFCTDVFLGKRSQRRRQKIPSQ